MASDSEDSSSSESSYLESLSDSPGPSPGASSDSDGEQQSKQCTKWPAGYPLPINDIYYTWPPDDGTPDPTTSVSRPIDPRARHFRSLYDINLLDRRHSVDMGPGADYGVLRKKWNARFQRRKNGDWDFVEYTPAWTDPDWDERYVYTGRDAAAWPEDHPLAQQYAKPGSFPTQRPALLDSDSVLNPTAAAKRWGIYPYQSGTFRDGSSGVSPMQSGFPSVPLEIPRWSDMFRAVQTEARIENVRAQRSFYESETRAAGGQVSEEGFRSYLEAAVQKFPKGSELWDMADKVLQVYDLDLEKNRRKEYQSMLFSGITTDELIQQGVWTMGMDATCNMAEPLHDLVTRDKWINTEWRGVEPEEPRIVYSISGKRGEMTAHNDEIWQALQPALQLFSKILASDHPITWAWADLRKFRPVRDARFAMTTEDSQQRIDAYAISNDVYRHDVFSVWPDFSCRVEDLDRVTARWNDVSRLVEAGFDTTRYVCEILKHTIEWDLQPEYRLGAIDAWEGQEPFAALGSTKVDLDNAPGSTRPFRIRVGIASDFVWQLLVDEYSPAEKAAASLAIAVTMLHELAHAVNVARFQMCAPRGVNDGKDPRWLKINPAWKQEIQDFSHATGVDIMAALRLHGLRNRVAEEDLEKGLMRNLYEVFLEDEPRYEEGWSTENQYFGGIHDTLGTRMDISVGDLDSSRFLSDMAVMACLRHWNTDGGTRKWFELSQALPAETYLKLFRKEFWDGPFRAYGHEALKLTGQPLSATLNFTQFSWDLAKTKFGPYAGEWMEKVYERLSEENDSPILWRWLYFKTVNAVEYLHVCRDWSRRRARWGATDRAIWKTTDKLKASCATLKSKIIENANFGGVGDMMAQDIAQVLIQDPVNYPDPLEVAMDFRAYYSSLRAAVQDLSREVIYNQNLAAAYYRLGDESAKQKIHQVYARKFRARMGLIYIITVDNIINLLDSLDSFSGMIAALLNATNGVRQIMDECRGDMKAKLKAIRLGFMAVMAIFSDDREEVRLGKSSLNAIPKSGEVAIAGRIERMAKLEYSRQAPGSSLKNIADDWMLILQSGDALINPPPGSDGDAFNQALAVRNHSVDVAADAQRQAAEAQHPDPQEGFQDQVSNLASQQPQHGQLSQERGFSDEQQQLYAAATGFRPIVDDQTRFTRFERLSGQAQAALAANPQPGNFVPGVDPTGFMDALEESIDARSAQAQYMNQTGTLDPSQSSTGGPLQFGENTAQSSRHLQEVEGMIRQRDVGRTVIGQLNMAAQGGQSAGFQGVEVDPYAAHHFVQGIRDFAQGASGGQDAAQGAIAPADIEMAEGFADFVEEYIQHEPHRETQQEP